MCTTRVQKFGVCKILIFYSTKVKTFAHIPASALQQISNAYWANLTLRHEYSWAPP